MTNPIDWAMRTAARGAAPGGRNGRLAVLLFHRVLPGTDALNHWDVTASQFERQLRVLRSHFSPLPLTEAIDRLACRSLPARAVCVTFDDGYADNVDVALPILRRWEVPATFFVATGYLNGGRMWNDSVVESVRHWREPGMDAGFGPLAVSTATEKRAAIGEILRRWKYLASAEREARAQDLARVAGVPPASSLMMSDTQVRTLRSEGMEIGAHTVTHPILRNLGDGEAAREIIDGGRYLAELLREPMPLFAYPNGQPGTDYGAREIATVRAAGYRAAVSTARGVASADADPYQLPRFTPWERNPWRFSLRLMLNYRNASPQTVSAAAGTLPPQTVAE